MLSKKECNNPESSFLFHWSGIKLMLAAHLALQLMAAWPLNTKKRVN